MSSIHLDEGTCRERHLQRPLLPLFVRVGGQVWRVDRGQSSATALRLQEGVRKNRLPEEAQILRCGTSRQRLRRRHQQIEQTDEESCRSHIGGEDDDEQLPRGALQKSSVAII